MFINGFSVTKWFRWYLAWHIFMSSLHRRFVLQLGRAKCIQNIFENLSCIAGNCVDVFWVHPWHTRLHDTSCMAWIGRNFSTKKIRMHFNNRYWNIASLRIWFGFFNDRNLARWNKLWATARSFVSRQVCDQDVCSLLFCSAIQRAMKDWRAWAEE